MQDEISSGWAKIERTFASWVVVLTSKLERDIKTTFMTGDVVSRRAAKDTQRLVTGVSELSKPVLSLPSAIQRLGEKEDSWDLIKAGVNPLEDGKLLGNFKASSTKQRAKLPKKKVCNVL